MNMNKSICIRAIGKEAPFVDGLRFFVTEESNAAIHLDNKAKDPRFRAAFTLVKMPSGHLANSVGQEFEILSREGK